MKTDFLILGGGLSGLIAAAYLEKKNQNYLLLEAGDEVGGLIRGQKEHGVWLDYGLKSIPVNDVQTNPLLKLKKDLDLDIKIETILSAPQVFQPKTGFIPFVGFGESQNRHLIAELSYYMESPRLLVSNGWKSLIDELLKIIPEKKIKTKSHITKINIDHNKVTDVVVNGEQSVTAQTIVFALPLNQLLTLAPHQALPGKFLQKLTKNSGFSALSLDVATKKRFSDQTGVLVLNDDHLHMVGQFICNADPLKQAEGLQISTWLCLLEEEAAHDDEASSKALKTMKKLLKKAFPEMLESIAWERIILAPFSHSKTIEIPEIAQNLWLVGSQISGSTKYLGSAIESVQNFAQKAL